MIVKVGSASKFHFNIVHCLNLKLVLNEIVEALQLPVV